MPDRVVLAPASWSEAVARAAAALRAGEVVLLPAEGLYGYHALPTLDRAAAKLEAIKPRGTGKGRIGLVARPADVYRWLATVPAPAAILIQAHWPGALTLVLDAGPTLPPPLLGPDRTTALRCPGSEFLRDVVLAAGGLVISTSANDPGEPPWVAAPEEHEVPEGIALVVDAGRLSGEPSTVVRVEGERVIVLRAGAIPVRATGVEHEGRGSLDAPPRGP